MIPAVKIAAGKEEKMELWTRALSDLIFPPLSLADRYGKDHPSSAQGIKNAQRSAWAGKKQSIEEKLANPPKCKKHPEVTMHIDVAENGRHTNRCKVCQREQSRKQKERIKAEQALRRRQTAASLPGGAATTKYGKNVNELRKLKGVTLHAYETQERV